MTSVTQPSAGSESSEQPTLKQCTYKKRNTLKLQIKTDETQNRQKIFTLQIDAYT